MRKLILPLALFTIIGCNHLADNDGAKTTERKMAASLNTNDGLLYEFDSASTIGWTGSKIDDMHSGIFKLKTGSFMVKDSVVKSGTFSVDMKTMNCTNLTGAEKTRLEQHLMSSDFFDVAKFEDAKFEITSVEFLSDSAKAKNLKNKDANYMVSGNLLLKAISKNISFPAQLSFNYNKFTLKADFKIDRTDWGLNYKGANNPADWIINKDVNLNLDIVCVAK
jgi:polyisoprenoid-binding protein YceI